MRSPFRRAEPLARPSPRTRAGPQCLLSRASALCPRSHERRGPLQSADRAGALRHRVPPEIERRGRRRESHAPRPAHAGLAHTPDRRAEPVSLGRSTARVRCSSPPSCGRSSSSGSRIASGSRSHTVSAGIPMSGRSRSSPSSSRPATCPWCAPRRRSRPNGHVGPRHHAAAAGAPHRCWLCWAGLAGRPRESRRWGNFMVDRGANGVDRWIWIDLESGIPRRSCLSTPWHSSGSTCRACCRVDGFSSTTLTFPCFAATWPATEPHW